MDIMAALQTLLTEVRLNMSATHARSWMIGKQERKKG